MHRYFIPNEGPRDFPRRSYARIDEVEPINLENADEINISFDAINAEWEGFAGERVFSLRNTTSDFARQSADYWAARFNPDRDGDSGPFSGRSQYDPFNDLPLYNIELTLDRTHPWLAQMLEEREAWFEIELSDTGLIAVDVFGGLFQASVRAFISEVPKTSAHSAWLTAAFSMDSWPDASQTELLSALFSRCDLAQLVVFDIGQGSATALLCSHGFPCLYYDVGCGVYANARTCPPSITFCTCEAPPVIISHWDSDHWAGAAKCSSLKSLTWIAPRQPIGPKHTAFASEILNAGGKILIVPASLPIVRWGSPQRCELRRATGSLSDRNKSGLILVVEDDVTGRAWLLTGDAGYNYVPGLFPADLAAVVVPHHGADMGAASIPPSGIGSNYRRLLYSFGPGNKYGKIQHPTAAAVQAHAVQGWPSGTWTSMPAPGWTVAGATVLATAEHLSNHLNGACVGWTAPPSAPGHLVTCSAAMKVTQF